MSAGAHRGQKRASDFLELKVEILLWMLAVQLGPLPELLTTESSLQPLG